MSKQTKYYNKNTNRDQFKWLEIPVSVIITGVQAKQILHLIDVPEIRAALNNSLRKEERRLEVEVAKVRLMRDAIETGDYTNLSDKLIQELNGITGKITLMLPEYKFESPI